MSGFLRLSRRVAVSVTNLGQRGQGPCAPPSSSQAQAVHRSFAALGHRFVPRPPPVPTERPGSRRARYRSRRPADRKRSREAPRNKDAARVSSATASPTRAPMRYISVLGEADLSSMTNLYDEFTWRGMVSDATDGLADVLGEGACDCVYRIRSHGVKPSRRESPARDGAGAAAALRPCAHCHRWRRHRYDRRSGAGSRRSGCFSLASRSRATWPASGSSFRAFSISIDRPTPRASSTTRTGSRRPI